MADEDPRADQMIRPEMHTRDVRLRTAAGTTRQVREARRRLRDIHRLETLAVQVYRAQWSPLPTELNRQLIAAMDNELTHQADSLSRLMEFGGRPTPLRLPFCIAGWLMGRASRCLGLRTMMRLGAWVEARAIEHYRHLAAAVEWHADTHRLVCRMWDDEKLHLARWEYYRDHPDRARVPPEESAPDAGEPT